MTLFKLNNASNKDMENNTVTTDATNVLILLDKVTTPVNKYNNYSKHHHCIKYHFI